MLAAGAGKRNEGNI